MPTLTTEQAAIRETINKYLIEQIESKLHGIDHDSEKAEEIRTKFSPTNWLGNAARRAGQLQLVSHPIKLVHPKIKTSEASSLFVNPDTLPKRKEIGSHCLSGSEFELDVTGNAAALDVFNFLRIRHQGKTLLDFVLSNDKDFIAALCDDKEQAETWMRGFSEIARETAPATHQLAKQVYWQVAAPIERNEDYHLLAPLQSSQLTHRLYKTINEHRFGESAKAARQARREQRDHPNGYCDYPQLASIKNGGSKPLNVSQLNAERFGVNFMLASLPPIMDEYALRPPIKSANALLKFSRMKDVRKLSNQLKKANQKNDLNASLALADLLFVELDYYSALIQQNNAGWTKDARCLLPIAQKLWLDPNRCDIDPEFDEQWNNIDWPKKIAAQFAEWIDSHADDSALKVSETKIEEWAQAIANNHSKTSV